MLNLFSFFKQQAADFRRDNKGRSADYLAGGADALREAGDCLTAQKDVVDLEWVTNQLNEAHKEARELRALNKVFDESRRTFQSRSDLQAKEILRLKEQLVKLGKHDPDLQAQITAITTEVQARADRQTGQWQSIAHSLGNLFREAATILTLDYPDPQRKVQAVAKVLHRALMESPSKKHSILANWLLLNVLMPVATPAATAIERGGRDAV